MAQGSDQIKQQIDQQRQRLGSNIREIESRVKRGTDWHTAFEKNPWMLMAAAAAGGLILSGFIGRASSPSTSAEETLSVAPSKHMQQISGTLDNIVGALIGVGTSKVKEFISDAVPGFGEHYQKLEHD